VAVTQNYLQGPANRWAKVDMLAIFEGHVVIQVTNNFSLLLDE
jgi:hypothetical protein